MTCHSRLLQICMGGAHEDGSNNLASIQWCHQTTDGHVTARSSFTDVRIAEMVTVCV